jgi:DNA-binding GntR family transcriptional regulator
MATFLQEPESEGADDEGVPKLTPITHLTLYERVYEELRNAIMSARFAPGETLTIRGLAQQLGTSVMPAREALRRLATEGAIEILPNRSIRIPLMNRSRLDEICSIRLLLEGEAASLAAKQATAAELAGIEAFNVEFVAQAKLNAVAKMLHANQRFHFAIYSAARSPTLLSLVGMLWLQTGPWLMEPLRRTLDRGANKNYIGVSIAHHQELIDALATRDSVRAAEAVRGDIRDAAAQFRAFVDGANGQAGNAAG